MESMTMTPPAGIPGLETETETGNEILTIKSDGTWVSGSSDGTWKLENNKFVLSNPDAQSGPFGNDVPFDYSFTNGGNHLTLTVKEYWTKKSIRLHVPLYKKDEPQNGR